MSKRVLVVDDDEVVRLVISKVAARHGAIATLARDGREALAALQEAGQFNVVFLDLLMPYVSGWDILSSIRGSEATAGTPVVIVSGSPISARERERLCANTNGYVEKETFSLTEFEPMVEALLAEGVDRREQN